MPEKSDKERGFKKMEKIIPEMDLFDEFLEGQIDKKSILKGLVAAIIAQEITRITVTKKPMNVNFLSEINGDKLTSYWDILAFHYRGGMHQRIFENGAMQLRKVPSEEISPLIQKIQYAIEPILNEEMSQRTLSLGLSIPFLGRIGLGNFRFSITGPRTAIRKFQLRGLRMLTEWCIMAAAILGTVHWFVWTIFNSSYLAYWSVPATSVMLLVLLLCATFMIWLCIKKEGLIVSKIKTKLGIMLYKILGLLILGFGWLYWTLWTLTDLPRTVNLLEPAMKLALPVYILSAALLGWIVGRISPNSLHNDN